MLYYYDSFLLFNILLERTRFVIFQDLICGSNFTDYTTTIITFLDPLRWCYADRIWFSLIHYTLLGVW